MDGKSADAKSAVEVILEVDGIVNAPAKVAKADSKRSAELASGERHIILYVYLTTLLIGQMI